MVQEEAQDKKPKVAQLECGHRDIDKICAILGEICLECDKTCPYWIDPADNG